jgi:hypothetical protein
MFGFNCRANEKDCGGGASRPKQTLFGCSAAQNAMLRESAARGCAETLLGLADMLPGCGKAALQRLQ